MAQREQVTVFNWLYSVQPQNTSVWSMLVTMAFFPTKLIGLSGSSTSKGNFPLMAEKKCTKKERKNNFKQTWKKNTIVLKTKSKI